MNIFIHVHILYKLRMFVYPIQCGFLFFLHSPLINTPYYSVC